MDNALYYLALNRQIGLSSELDVIANNVANLGTAGFQREGLAFSEFVIAAEAGDSTSMADLHARFASRAQGVLSVTNGELDVAIDGAGYFLVESGAGPILTRAGAFMLSPEGFLVTPEGGLVLDAALAPIAVPPSAGPVSVASDGTLSAAGLPIAQLAVVDAPPEIMRRERGTAFRVDDDAFEAVATPRVVQGALEGSNVNPVNEISRMIEVTRAYESAQSIIEDEDERITRTIRTLGQSS